MKEGSWNSIEKGSAKRKKHLVINQADNVPRIPSMLRIYARFKLSFCLEKIYQTISIQREFPTPTRTIHVKVKPWFIIPTNIFTHVHIRKLRDFACCAKMLFKLKYYSLLEQFNTQPTEHTLKTHN